MKVAFLTNIISPYRRPVFQELARTPGWDLSVLVNAKSEFDRQWSGDCDDVAVIQPRTWSIRRRRTSVGPVSCTQVVELHVPIGLWAELSRLMPDVVITHELGPRSWIAAQWARWHKRPLVVWSYQARASIAKDGFVRRRIRDAILGRADSVVGMGVQARAVLHGYGVPDDKILDAPNATDVAMIDARLRRVRADGAVQAVRGRLSGSMGKQVCLVAGRIEPVKHIEGTLKLWSRLPQAIRDDWNLVFVGNGSQEHLITACEDPSILHLPAVPMEQMADYYAASDLHLFASLADVWGLVVNESMLAGLPTLCSRLAGCSDDLIDDGRNGLLFDPGDEDSALAALQSALMRGDLRLLGRSAREDGKAYTIERLAAAFRESVRRAMATRDRQPAGVADMVT